MRDLLAKSVDSHQVEIYKHKFAYYDLTTNEEDQLVFKDARCFVYKNWVDLTLVNNAV